MKQYGLLILSILVFFVLFYNLNSNEQIETFSPMTSDATSTNLDVNHMANAVDATYLNAKTTQLVNLKNDLSKIRDTLYNKKLSDFLIIQPTYKTLDDANPQQFDVDITKEGDFSNIIHLSVPIGTKGVQGPVGNKGSQGKKGETGEKGPVGHCGAIIS